MHSICKRIRQAQQDVARSKELVELRINGHGLKKVHWIKGRRKTYTKDTIYNFLVSVLKYKSSEEVEDIRSVATSIFQSINSPWSSNKEDTYYINGKQFIITIC